MSIKNIIYDAVTNSLKLLSRRTDQPSVVIPLTPGQLMPVGSIIQSIMTEAEFQAEAGTSWVLMDGRSIVGSKLARIKSITNIQDASGKFLRTFQSGVTAALGVAQSDATAVKGLGGTATLGTTAKSLTSGSAVSAGSHTHNYHWSYSLFQAGSNNASPVQTGGSTWATDADGAHTHTVTGSTDIAHSHTLAVTSTDTETRPVNLTVNTFIKIN